MGIARGPHRPRHGRPGVSCLGHPQSPLGDRGQSRSPSLPSADHLGHLPDASGRASPPITMGHILWAPQWRLKLCSSPCSGQSPKAGWHAALVSGSVRTWCWPGSPRGTWPPGCTLQAWGSDRPGNCGTTPCHPHLARGGCQRAHLSWGGCGPRLRTEVGAASGAPPEQHQALSLPLRQGSLPVPAADELKGAASLPNSNSSAGLGQSTLRGQEIITRPHAHSSQIPLSAEAAMCGAPISAQGLCVPAPTPQCGH